MTPETTQNLDVRYNPEEIEQKWYESWEKEGLFKPSKDPNKKPYTVSVPPPNITGALHMGHSLCYPIQDAVGRYKRLKGYSVWLLPGQDHAGIATQSLVEKQLKKDGLSKHDLGREKFLEKVWEWRKKSGDTILSQFKKLGCSFDWDSTRFTLDDEYVRAVLQVFIEWFDKGYIYRGKRIVNWDPVLQTSVSDIETERRESKGKLYHVRYLFSDGSGEIVIATTRPETIPADVAVAVNPRDKRYEGVVGKTLILPLTGREIPIIADDYPDPEFGTGALKITPAHDINDYEVGVRHHLPMLEVIDKDAKITDLYPKYKGMDRFEARKCIAEELEKEGSLVKIEDHDIALVISERSGQPVEPLLSEQWFVKQTELAKDAIDIVKKGEIKFVPERYEKVYIDWMENIKDWCVSRQLWWGHRIPVYYGEKGNCYAAQSWEDAQTKAGTEKIISQDEDVLDTWFSSGLWPFAVLGWPEKTPDLESRYPTDLLVTDRNILYLWVARMIMMGMDFIDLKPFHEVFIHATVLTEDGRRMSKSLGTGVDPETVIEKMGVDPLRYTLLGATGENQEIRYSEKKNEESRNFCSKIWSASRFILMNLKDIPEKPDKKDFHGVDKWILSRLARLSLNTSLAYDRYDLMNACQQLQNFFWYEFCDWYIEISKNRLHENSSKDVVSWVLLKCLEAFLIQIHPILPHLTEEIYQKLPLSKKSEYIMTAQWPEDVSEFLDDDAEDSIAKEFNIVKSIRSLRADVGISPGKVLDVIYLDTSNRGQEFIDTIKSLAKFKEVKFSKPETDKIVSVICDGIEIYLPIDSSIDTDVELRRVKQQIDKLKGDMDKIGKRLNNPDFIEKAKPELVASDKLKFSDLEDHLIKLEHKVNLLSNIT